jgi:plasmid maintenance system antidote protein VapI
MPKPKKTPTMTDVLRQTIRESGIPMLRLSEATGVDRLSIARFVNESQSLRLDCADKLATYFGLVLVKQRAK